MYRSAPMNYENTGLDSKDENENSSEENGSCYMRLRSASEFLPKVFTYPKFTGNDAEIIKLLVAKQVEIMPAHTKWIKKKADKNCLSVNPEDCLVWCLVDVEQEIKTVHVLQDTFWTNEFIIEKLELQTKNEASEKSWYKVVCKNRLTNNLIQRCKVALYNKGYQVLPSSVGKTNAFLEAIKQYQIDNELIVGFLTVETYEHLIE